jgi:hypothetical protein
MDVNGLQVLIGLIINDLIEIYAEGFFSGRTRCITFKPNGRLFYSVFFIVNEGYGVPFVIP